MKFTISQATLEELLMSSNSRHLLIESLEETLASEEEAEIKVVNHNRTTHEDYPVKGYRHAKRRKNNMHHKENDRVRKNNSHWDYKMWSSGRNNEFGSSAKEKRYDAKGYFDAAEIQQTNPEDYEIYRKNVASLFSTEEAMVNAHFNYSGVCKELKEIEETLEILRKKHIEAVKNVEQSYSAFLKAEELFESMQNNILAFEEGVHF